MSAETKKQGVHIRPSKGKACQISGSFLAGLPARFKSYRRNQKIGIVFLFAVFLFASWSLWFYGQLSEPANLFEEIPGGYPDDLQGIDRDAWDAGSYFDQNIVNVALLGFDREESSAENFLAYRSDSIKVISINLDAGVANIINIPRDIYVRIADTQTMDKINHAYFYGFRYGRGDDPHVRGMEYTLKSISYALGGIPLKYYVAVDMDGVVELVDSIGGVEFTVEQDIYFHDTLWVNKGHQVLDGTAYLRYLRSREIGGDIGRVNRQTDLLLATLEHFEKQGLFKHIPALYNASHHLLDTNLTGKQIVSLALYVRNFSKDEIQSHTLSGGHQYKDGVYYMVMNQSRRSEIIESVFGIDFPVQPQESLKDTVPAKPKAFTADYLLHSSGQRGLLLTWEAGDRFNHTYNLYRLGEGPEELLAAGLAAESFWYMDVSMGNTYHFRLEAVNRQAISKSISLKKAIKAAERPAKPTAFKAHQAGGDITLTWMAADNKTTGFRLLRKSLNTPDEILVDHTFVTKFVDVDLAPQEYSFYLVAVDANGLYSEAVTLKVEVVRESEPTPPQDPPDDAEDP